MARQRAFTRNKFTFYIRSSHKFVPTFVYSISYFKEKQENFCRDGIMKNGKKLYNERGITFFHETERYVNNLNIYNRSKKARTYGMT